MRGVWLPSLVALAALGVEVGDDAVSEAVKVAHLARSGDLVDLREDRAELTDHASEWWVYAAGALTAGQVAAHGCDEPVAGLPEQRQAVGVHCDPSAQTDSLRSACDRRCSAWSAVKPAATQLVNIS